MSDQEDLYLGPTIYVSRHGYRYDWDNPLGPEHREGDSPLHERGEKQAKELSAFLAQEAPKPRTIFVSPFRRCIQTIYPFAAANNTPIKLEMSISEWLGPHRPINPGTAELYKEEFPLINSEHKSRIDAPKNETKKAVYQRCLGYAHYLERTYCQPDHPVSGDLIFVTHAAVVIMFGRALLRDPEAKIRCGTATVTKYRFLKKERKWTQIQYFTDHLSEGEVRHWDFPDEE